MKAFEETMIVSVQKKIKDANKKYFDDSPENGRSPWILSLISQAAAVIDLITWTEDIEIALNDLLDDRPFAINNHFNFKKQQFY